MTSPNRTIRDKKTLNSDSLMFLSQHGYWSYSLLSYEEIPELAELSGHSVEYLIQRLDHAKQLGPKFRAGIDWTDN